MGIEILLSRLDRVKKTGDGRWLACCSSHEDASPSLSIRETTDGVILLKCWAGCSASEIVTAVGLNLQDLFPPRESSGKAMRQPFFSYDAMQILAIDLTVAASIFSEILAGEPVSTNHREKIVAIAAKLGAAVSAIRPSIKKERRHA